MCGDWHQADDLLQTALVKLYVAWPRLHRDGREEAYVRQIIVRANIDESPPALAARERSGPRRLRRGAPGRAALEERSALFDAIQELPSMQRRTVLLRHWLGLSVEQTASELGISTGTVKSHTSRGIEKLQALLVEQPFETVAAPPPQDPPRQALSPERSA